jgi:type II secretory pathway component HofQ
MATAAPSLSVDAGALAPVPGLRRRGGLLDIDVHKVDVRRLLSQIAAFTGTNIVMLDDVKGTVTVQVRGVPLTLAVATVARGVGCLADLTGGMILIRCAPETKPSPKPVRGPDFP